MIINNIHLPLNGQIIQHRKKMKLKQICVVIVLFVLCFSIKYMYNGTHSKSIKIYNNTKTILFWNKMFGRSDFYFGIGNIFEHCEFSNCVATDDKYLLPVEEFDALLFHTPEGNRNMNRKPKKRLQKQFYIFYNLESPLNSHLDLKDYDNFFNWTMTYRQNSDVVRGYGYMEKCDQNYTLPTEENIRKKTKKIAWFVSNCQTTSNRINLYMKLKKYIDIDVYGDCGKLSCPKSTLEECYNHLENKYKFYLSFENSICTDYVSEKLYNVLQKNIVPIVYGGANYDKIVPKNSVIDVTKYESVKKLAEHLKFLDENPKEYLKYFEWKKSYKVDISNKRALCELCEKLHKAEPKIYQNIYKWWYGDQQSSCKVGDQLPKIMFTD